MVETFFRYVRFAGRWFDHSIAATMNAVKFLKTMSPPKQKFFLHVSEMISFVSDLQSSDETMLKIDGFLSAEVFTTEGISGPVVRNYSAFRVSAFVHLLTEQDADNEFKDPIDSTLCH